MTFSIIPVEIVLIIRWSSLTVDEAVCAKTATEYQNCGGYTQTGQPKTQTHFYNNGFTTISGHTTPRHNISVPNHHHRTNLKSP
jgi:hypothetical protein